MSYKTTEKEKYKLEELEFDLPNDYTKLNCPSCGNDIPANDININDKIAKCGSCHAIFPFYKEIEHLLAPDTTKQEIIKPEGIDIFRFRDNVDFTIKQPLTILEGILFGLMPLSLLFMIVGLTKGNLPLALFGILWILLGITYGFIWHYRHKIHLSINKRFLMVKWKPRKAISTKTYRTEDIDQIYLGNSSTGLAVFAIINSVNGQKHVKLIPSVTSLSKAKYLEQEIEKYLGIIDRRVPEEIIQFPIQNQSSMSQLNP